MGRATLISNLVAKGGPEPSEYETLTEWVASLRDALDANEVDESELAEIRAAFGDSLSLSTMQGFAFAKPHGYAGDFEIIDRIYSCHTAEETHLTRWDEYFHSQAAPTAVRNRKTYFHGILNRWAENNPTFRVLNVASGPGRCMYEWLAAHPERDAYFHCVELDPKAIAFATELNKAFKARVQFVQSNILRWKPTGAFDVVWAAGIFDYFPDSVFVAVLKRLLRAVRDGGELVIGNFAVGNPSRAYMETVGDWKLHHRSAEALISLATLAEVELNQCRVGAEAVGVNLFLHVQR